MARKRALSELADLKALRAELAKREIVAPTPKITKPADYSLSKFAVLAKEYILSIKDSHPECKIVDVRVQATARADLRIVVEWEDADGMRFNQSCVF